MRLKQGRRWTSAFGILSLAMVFTIASGILQAGEALYVLQGRTDGTPIEEIRKQIDLMYGGGKAGKPTATPAP